MDQNNEPKKVVFESDEFSQYARTFQKPTPKIVQWVITYSKGRVKDEQQATYVLLGFVAIAVIVSLFLVFGANKLSLNREGVNEMKELHPELFKKPRAL